MNCGCAREMEELQEIGCNMMVDYDGNTEGSEERFAQDYTECMKNDQTYFQDHMRCMPNGNFDDAMCIAQVLEDEDDSEDEEVCFCLDQNLNITSVSVVFIGEAYLMLECHLVDETHYPGYYRPCELEAIERKKKIRS